MLSVGIDPHKLVFTAVALDAQARNVASFSDRNAPPAFPSFLEWLRSLPGPVEVAIEGAFSFGRPLARFLVSHGFSVFDCNPRWTAAFRSAARRQHKTDLADAQAVAQVLLRDGADLPRVLPDDTSSVLDIIVSERDALLAEMTRTRNQLHALVFDLGVVAPALTTSRAIESLLEGLPEATSPRSATLLASVRRLASRLLSSQADIALLTKEIQRPCR